MAVHVDISLTYKLALKHVISYSLSKYLGQIPQ